MTVINTGLTTVGIRAELFSRMDAVTTYYQDLCTRVPSTTETERYRWLGTVPVMREWGTGRMVKGLRSESYDVENTKYEATIEVDRDEIDDDQTAQIRMRIGELAVRAATHKDKLISDLLANGASSGFNSYDGVTFFNAAHVSGASGSQDNILSPTAVAPDAPTVAEFQAALKEAIARMMGFLDDVGEPATNTGAEGFVIVCPPIQYLTALEAINTTIVQSVRNILEGAARVIAFPRLTDLSKFFLLKVNEAVRPFIFQDRMPVEFRAVEGGSEEEFLREKYLYGVRARYNITYGYWQYACSVDFTEPT